MATTENKLDVTTDRNSDEADALDVILAASKPTPPASIPAAEVQALVEADEEYDAAREFLAQQRQQAGAINAAEARFREALLRRAVALRELAKLIPRGK